MATATAPEVVVGNEIVIDGAVRTIRSIKGRWVNLDDGSNVSRAQATAGREEYLEDRAVLGDELDDPDQAEEQEVDQAEQATVDVTGYTGPMLALRERLQQGAYQKAPNGQPCCGDPIAIALGVLTPAQVIRACIIAMNLPGNPYVHLNIGQQSMNLRNKLRGCMKRGEFGHGVLVEAIEVVQEEDAESDKLHAECSTGMNDETLFDDQA